MPVAFGYVNKSTGVLSDVEKLKKMVSDEVKMSYNLLAPPQTGRYIHYTILLKPTKTVETS